MSPTANPQPSSRLGLCKLTSPPACRHPLSINGEGEWTSACGRCEKFGEGEWTSACGRCEKFGEGEDARVAGVVDLARRNGCPPRRALLIWRGGKTPALRALLIWRGGTDGRHGGRFWLWHRRHRRRRRGQSRQHQSGRAPQIYRQTKNKTRHGSPQTGCLL